MQKLDFAAEHERGAGQGQARGCQAKGLCPLDPRKGGASGSSPIGAKIGRLRDALAPLSSWSGLDRPSTPWFVARKEDMDSWHKAGHDDKPRRRATILAPMWVKPGAGFCNPSVWSRSGWGSTVAIATVRAGPSTSSSTRRAGVNSQMAGPFSLLEANCKDAPLNTCLCSSRCSPCPRYPSGRAHLTVP